MDRVYFHYLHMRESIINIFTQYRWPPEILQKFYQMPPTQGEESHLSRITVIPGS